MRSLAGDLPDGQITGLCRIPVKPSRQKYFAFSEAQIRCMSHRIPLRSEQLWRSSPVIGRPQGWRWRAPAFGG